MRCKRVMAAALAAALSIGSAMSSMAAGWEQVGASDWKYLNDDGKYAASKWVAHTDGHWYYLKADTLMAKGWVLDPADNHWYFTDSTGALVRGLIEVNNNVYYMNETHDGTFGALYVGQKTINGVTYNFTDNGTTNGKPYTAKKYNSDGTAIAAASSSSGSSGGGGSSSSSSPLVKPQVLENLREVDSEINTQIEEAKSSGVVKSASEVTTRVTGDNQVTKSRTVTLEDDAASNSSKLAEAQDLVERMFEETIVGRNENIPVVATLPDGLTLKFDGTEDLEKLAEAWINETNYNKYKGQTGSYTVTLEDGTEVTYRVTLN